MNLRKTLYTYFPGILLFFFALLIGILTYQDYGIAWDEPEQRDLGTTCYNYVFKGDTELLVHKDRQYGTGFELPLVILERSLRITDSRDVYLMRHWVTHFFFLLGVLSGYILFFRLYRNKFIATIGFIMLAFCPRIYAHSFFNTKDIPFLSMVIVVLTCCHIAFDKNKTLPFFVLGLLCGYTTSIRVMGIMLCAFILLLLLIDLFSNLAKQKKGGKPAANLFVFLFGFCITLYSMWPYLWRAPIHNFIESYSRMSHFNWVGSVFINGKMEPSTSIPWSYFPTWFLISNPVVWLCLGFSGIILAVINFSKRPFAFFKNGADRNTMLYLFCFAIPIIAVVVLHSVIYDDWRQLYFVYPPFVLLALYFINKIYSTRYRSIIQLLCIVQTCFIGYFMIKDHPFQQVYFNELVSHRKEYIRHHYEMDYWGCGMKQALDHLLSTNPSGTIKVCSNGYREIILQNNIQLLKELDRKRIEITDTANADYFLTNFRMHPDDFSYKKIDYSINILNSTVLCIYKTHE